jgi:Fe-S cluster assembly ATP-binding protein
VELVGKYPEERARAGLYLAFQSPVAIPGVKLSAFLRTAYKNLHPEEKLSVNDFYKLVSSHLKKVGLDESFMSRAVNDGFSGGERKRLEILQMVILRPKIIVLDEIDSGLDVDALSLISDEILQFFSKETAFLIVTHYQRILKKIDPQFVHVLMNGHIAKEGDRELALRIENEGYDWIRGN